MSSKSVVVRLKDIAETSNFTLNPSFWVDNEKFLDAARRTKFLRVTEADLLLMRYFNGLLKRWGIRLPENLGTRVTQLEKKMALLSLRSRKPELRKDLEKEIDELQRQLDLL